MLKTAFLMIANEWLNSKDFTAIGRVSDYCDLHFLVPFLRQVGSHVGAGDVC